jgi:hypothetical protein
MGRSAFVRHFGFLLDRFRDARIKGQMGTMTIKSKCRPVSNSNQEMIMSQNPGDKIFG